MSGEVYILWLLSLIQTVGLLTKNKLSHIYAFAALLPIAQLVSDGRFSFATLDL